jgi:hypothetical protein
MRNKLRLFFMITDNTGDKNTRHLGDPNPSYCLFTRNGKQIFLQARTPVGSKAFDRSSRTKWNSVTFKVGDQIAGFPRY